MRFKTTLVPSDTGAYIEIPFDPNEVWGEKERHHITGSIEDHTIRGCLESRRGGFILSLGPAWLRGFEGDAGAEVEVVLAPEGPQLDTLSPDILAALDPEPEAKAFFLSLASFYRKNYVRWIESAKRPETRSKRITEMVELLKAGQKQR
ncbi:MAG: YdeI/OmpD-associated family protein [Armatimonadetes bacterium]|nr:YdeI/OmpD-associated family protein [Armatimonadota bacterium]